MYGHLLDQTPQDWSLMMNVNLISVSYLTQLASKLMLENPKESSNEIIFINSMAGHVENDNAMTTMYNCTKFALTTLIENWRKEVRSLGLAILQVFVFVFNCENVESIEEFSRFVNRKTLS